MTVPELAVKHVVLDSGPLLTAHIPSSPNTRYYTLPSVMSEIRDAPSRERIAALPFQIALREASGESLREVLAFAREVTGDAAALSKVDLQVIALAVDLAKQHDKWTMAASPSTGIQVHHGGEKKSAVKKSVGFTPENAAAAVADEDSEGEWITPANVAEKKQRDLLKVIEQEPAAEVTSTVTCMTSDFAMQNVLLRLRLSVTSVNGQRIRQLKSWMLRCHACYWYTPDSSRRFCDRCGGPTLIRTSYKLDEQGQAHFFLAKNFQYNLRGSRYDIPLPQGGRAPDIITREDQKEFIRAVRTQTRVEGKELKAMLNASTSASVNDADERLAGIFGGMEIASDALKKKSSGSSTSAPRVRIGMGRRNPNEVRRH